VDKEASREVRRKIRRVLMEQWDPIGVSDTPDAADEYDLYIGDVYELLKRGASAAKIGAYLRGIEVDRMGMVDANGEPLLAGEKRSAATSALTELAPYFPK
jgi:hypothetical protein